MKIVIDATPIGVVTPDKGGVYRYIFQLVDALGRLETDDRFVLFFNFFRRRHAAVMAQIVNRLQLPANFTTCVARVPPGLWMPLGLPAESWTGRFDVFHNCIDRLPRLLFGKGVVTVHDVRYLEGDLPPVALEALEWLRHSPDWQADYRNRMRHLGELERTIASTVARAERIIAVSEFTKQRLVDKLKVAAQKITVIHHGVDPRYRPQSAAKKNEVRGRYRLPPRYVAYVGKLDPWKDLPTLFEALRRMKDKQVALVMTGPLNWYKSYLDQRLDALGLRERVHYTGYVEEDDLPGIYCAAECAVLPSLYEGFGLPLLEAMACGTPVVASRVGAIPEVGAGCVSLVPPQDAGAMSNALDEVLGSNADRETAAAAGLARSAAFDWHRCAIKTLAEYRIAAS